MPARHRASPSLSDGTTVRRHDTAARRAIVSAVACERRSFTARELYDRLQSTRPVGLTTVYRTLALLVGDGTVREAGRRRGEALYATCELTGHHHHLICEACGVVVGSEVCHCEALESDLSAHHGFVLRASDSNYYGLCAACATGGGNSA
jgi:Fur family ferric uptake transcriptional regulator